MAHAMQKPEETPISNRLLNKFELAPLTFAISSISMHQISFYHKTINVENNRVCKSNSLAGIQNLFMRL